MNKKQLKLNIIFLGCMVPSFFGFVINKSVLAAEKVECGEGAKVSVVNGVIVCETEKPVPAKTDCDTYNYKTEVVSVYHSDLTKLTQLVQNKGIDCAKVIGTLDNPKSIIISGQETYPLPGKNPIYAKNSIKPLQLLKEAIANLDNPLERVNMDIWAIELASADSARLANVMEQINREIDQTRYAMQLTFRALTNMGREITVSPEQKNDNRLTRLIVKTDVRGDQRLSLMDILFRINMANKAPLQSTHEQPITYAEKSNDIDDKITKNQMLIYDTAASRLCNFLVNNNSKPQLFARFNQYEGGEIKSYEMRSIFTNDPIPHFRRPFQRFQEIALHQRFKPTSRPKCSDGHLTDLKLKLTEREEDKSEIDFVWVTGQEWIRRQNTLLNYLDSIEKGDAMKISESAAKLDSILSPIVDAINLDVEDYFIKPTLQRIKEIVGRDRSVEYAEVGKISLSGLNGMKSQVMSTNTNSLDEPTPLRLDKLIQDANEINNSTKNLLPGLSKIPLPTGLNALDPASAVSILAALSKEDQRWRTMSNGIDFSITPTVLRDRTSALLDIDFKKAKPENESVSISEKNPLRAPSQTSATKLTTKVRVNVMDLFALSSLNNQTTITGRRWNVPIVGPIWEGIFGDIPVVGNLLSPRRPPVNIQHQTIMITNTLIVPSAKGLLEANPELNSQYNQNNLNVQNYQKIQDTFLILPPAPQPAPRY
jgi:hypothetical protein